MAQRQGRHATPIQVRDVSLGRVRRLRSSPAAGIPALSRSVCSPVVSASLGELQLTNIGSSLKFCLLAEGAADCYPRLAPTSQWDTAAAQGVLEGAGGEVLDLSGERSAIRRGNRC
jgi:3'(2'), 5'-bisphosphate nucleotidase